MARSNPLGGWTPQVLSLFRIVTGLCFLQHGTQKILGLPAGSKPPGIDLSTLAGWSGPIELVGGALIVLGLFTRPTAFVLSGFMAIAYWMVHAPQGPYPINNGGELAVIYSFAFLYLVFAGGGPISVDRMIGRRR